MTVRIGDLHEITQVIAELAESVKATIEVISETIKRIADHVPRIMQIIKKYPSKVRMPRKPVRCIGCKPDTRGKVRRHPRTKAERRNQ